MSKCKVYLALGRPLCGVDKVSFDTMRDAKMFLKGAELASGYNDLKASMELSEVVAYVIETDSNLDKQSMLKELRR